MRVRSKIRGSCGEEGSFRACSNKIRIRGGRSGGRREGENGEIKEKTEGGLGLSENETKKEIKSEKKEGSKSKLALRSLKRISDQV